MSLTGIPGKPAVPAFGEGGAFLLSLQGLDRQTADVLTQAWRQINEKILDLRRALDIAYTDMASNANGMQGIVGLSGSTQQAFNFANVGMALGGSTQFTWSFGVTEPDTTYGILVGLNGPNTLPTVMKFQNRVRFDFGGVTPAGLTGDMLLFR